MRAQQLKALKVAVFLLALVPLARVVWLGFADRLGANPIELITRDSGSWALYFLCMTLAVTPLRRATGWNWLVRLRRMLGVFAFFYALLHFTAFLWFDHFFDLGAMWRDVLKRPFITVGFVAFLLLIPLAATSSDAAMRRLGGRRWQRLHRAIYLIAPLTILHFWWMKAGKNDLGEPFLFGAVVAVLLLARLFFYLRRGHSATSPLGHTE